jgi:hypothetical protein
MQSGLGNLPERSLAIYFAKFERLYRNINEGTEPFIFSRILNKNLKFDFAIIVHLGSKLG